MLTYNTPHVYYYKQPREEAAILELRREERNFFLAYGGLLTTLVVTGQLLAHVLTSGKLESINRCVPDNNYS